MSRKRYSHKEYSYDCCNDRGHHSKPLCIRRNLNHHYEPPINKIPNKSKLISKLNDHDNKK